MALPAKPSPNSPPVLEIQDRAVAAAEREEELAAEAAEAAEAALAERSAAAANSKPFKVFAGVGAMLFFGASALSNSVNGFIVEGAFDAWIAILGAGFAADGFGAFEAARAILGRTLSIGSLILGALLLILGAYFSYVGISGGDRAFYLLIGAAFGGIGAVSLLSGISGILSERQGPGPEESPDAAE